MSPLNILTLVAGWIICLFVGGLGLTFLVKIWTVNIDISLLISEVNGDASMSSFHVLVFLIVFALSLLLVIVVSNRLKFPAIPGTVLSLIGISGSSYLFSKAIQLTNLAGISGRSADIVICPARA